MSESFSFAIWNNILIGKASQDNYFEIGSFCYNDQYLIPNDRKKIRDNCQQCTYDPEDLMNENSTMVSLGNQE